MGLIGNISSTQAIYGSSVPISDIGADGDIYVQSTDARVSRVWKKESGVWNAIGATTSVTSGTAAPNIANGNQGDVYLKVDANSVVLVTYQKLSGAWVQVGDVNPIWTNFTPTIVSETGTITTIVDQTIRYRKIGTILFAMGSFTITNAGTGGGYISVTLPVSAVTAANGAGHQFLGGGVDGVMLTVATSAGSQIAIWKYDGTTAITAPMGYSFTITYETAS